MSKDICQLVGRGDVVFLFCFSSITFVTENILHDAQSTILEVQKPDFGCEKGRVTKCLFGW